MMQAVHLQSLQEKVREYSYLLWFWGVSLEEVMILLRGRVKLISAVGKLACEASGNGSKRCTTFTGNLDLGFAA